MKHIINLVLLLAATFIFSFLQFFITGVYGHIVFYPLIGLMVLNYVMIYTFGRVK